MTQQTADSNCRMFSAQFVTAVGFKTLKDVRLKQEQRNPPPPAKLKKKPTKTNKFSSSCVRVCLARCCAGVLAHSAQSPRLAELLLFQCDSDGLCGCLAASVVFTVLRVNVLTKPVTARRNAQQKWKRKKKVSVNVVTVCSLAAAGFSSQ